MVSRVALFVVCFAAFLPAGVDFADEVRTDSFQHSIIVGSGVKRSVSHASFHVECNAFVHHTHHFHHKRQLEDVANIIHLH